MTFCLQLLLNEKLIFFNTMYILIFFKCVLQKSNKPYIKPCGLACYTPTKCNMAAIPQKQNGPRSFAK
jgi:hypothetical protein